MIIESWGKTFKKEVKVINNIENLIGESFIVVGNQNSLSDCFIPKNDYLVKQEIHISKNLTHPLTTVSDFIKNKRQILFGTPGNPLVTLGGAIAADTYGKEGYLGGSFFKNVKKIKLKYPNGKIVSASKEENTDLFEATFGGYGLTGQIKEIQFNEKLIEYSENFEINVVKGNDMGELVNILMLKNNNFAQIIFDLTNKNISWILKSAHPTFKYPNQGRKFNVSNFSPSLRFIGDNYFKSLSLMHKYLRFSENNRVSKYSDFIFPINPLTDPRNFCKNGEITEIQFSIPRESFNHIPDLLSFISKKKIQPIACNLKYLANQKIYNNLSFYQEGYALTLNFPTKNLDDKFIEELFKKLLLLNCKINLSKDTLLNPYVFKEMYPEYSKWIKVVKKYDIDNNFQSALSNRLKLK